MAARLEFAVRGNLRRALAQQAKAVDAGTRTALSRSIFGLRRAVKRRIAAARLGGLHNLLHAKVNASYFSARLKSVAVMGASRQRRGTVDLVTLFDQGATVRAANGRFLAIPTGEGPMTTGRGRARLMAPDEMVAKGIKTELRRTAKGFVVLARLGGRLHVTHVLVRQVRLKKRYTLKDVVDRWVQGFPARLAIEIERAAAKRGLSDAF